MGHATLVDTTKCVGCRSCQVSCKQWNGLPAELTRVDGRTAGLQQPASVSFKTRTVVTFNEVANDSAPGGMNYVFVKRQCMHCLEPACVSACPVTAMHQTPDGVVAYDADKCMGCRYCVWACPFGAPAAEWDSRASRINKCDGCYGRALEAAPTARNGEALSQEDAAGFASKHAQPACVSQCPPGALEFGDRDELLARARQRIRDNPGKYVDHIYGEHEAGGTGWIYLAAVPFSQLGMPDVGTQSYPARSTPALAAVAPGVSAVGAVLGVTYALQQRKERISRERQEPPAPPQAPAHGANQAAARAEAHHAAHPEFAPLQRPFWTRTNQALLVLMLGGVASLVARFALGLGASTGLSDTYAWGLWIVFDLVWIALAAGAFATAGLIYVLRRHELYGLGRASVLLGLLSYSFVAVTLLADLGLPWHFWQLAFNAPEHSAMYEVSWCVSLYVTILAVEFAPVPLKWLGLTRAMDAWKRLAPLYVVAAVTGFVYLMSRNLGWTALAFAVFATLAVVYRPRPGEAATPLLPAMAAVTFSTMHQSSLGSLFLLMPDKLHPLWWSPMMPLLFLVSAVAAGCALVMLVELWMARVYRYQAPHAALAGMGKVVAVALLLAWMLRLSDLVVRGQLGSLALDSQGLLFLTEALLGGVLPLLLLWPAALRRNPALLALGAALTAGGVVLHRTSVVLLAMNLKGPMPQVVAPTPYSPSLVEWGISVGLVATTVFLFGLGVRKLPVLPERELLEPELERNEQWMPSVRPG